MYFVELDSDSGALIKARLVPMQMRRFRLERVSAADAKWLCNLVNKLGKPYGTPVKLDENNSLSLECR
jgi:poly-gamma-glutamate capsule biosynthesis protein CapA/YwtB (metallophosphatase superfamily)